MSDSGQGGGRPTRTSRVAIASLVVSLLWLSGLGSVLGVMLGVIALVEIRRTRQPGRGLAIAGICLGVVGVVLGALLWSAIANDLDEANWPGDSPTEACLQERRAVDAAVATYVEQTGSYPDSLDDLVPELLAERPTWHVMDPDGSGGVIIRGAPPDGCE